MKRLLPFIQHPSRIFDRSAWTDDLARLGFVAALICLGLLGFIETMLAPGRLIRRPLGFAVVDPLASPIPAIHQGGDVSLHPTVAAIDGLLGTDKQRDTARDKTRQQVQSLIESRYQLARRPLDSAYAEHSGSWERFVVGAKQVLSVDLSVQPYDPGQTPARLNRLVLEDASVKAAWTGLRQVASSAHRLQADVTVHHLTRPEHLSTEQDVADYQRRSEALVTRVAAHRTELEDAIRFDLEHLRIAMAADKRLNP